MNKEGEIRIAIAYAVLEEQEAYEFEEIPMVIKKSEPLGFFIVRTNTKFNIRFVNHRKEISCSEVLTNKQIINIHFCNDFTFGSYLYRDNPTYEKKHKRKADKLNVGDVYFELKEPKYSNITNKQIDEYLAKAPEEILKMLDNVHRVAKLIGARNSINKPKVKINVKIRK